jgi:chromosome segregation ATPase
MEGGFIQLKAKTLIEAWGRKQGLQSRAMHQFMQKKSTEDPSADKFVGRGGGDATYVAKGGDVTEILKKMLMEYEDDLVALEKAEAETKAAYDLADDAKKLAIAASTKSKETKEEVLGEKGQELSNTKDDLKEAQDALLADTTVLTDTTTTCKKRGDEYEQHMKTREGETAAMQQAIEILEKVTGVRSPEEKGITPTFTQLKAVQVRKHKDPTAGIIAVLRKVKGGKNMALSKLADKIEKLGKQMPGSGTFDQIKNMIEKMIFHLIDEQKNEDEHKHWCDKEITNTELMIKEKTEKSEDADSTITQLAEKIQNLKNGIKENQDFIAETTEEIATRTEDRAEDKKENEATIKDAEDAQAAIAEAIAVLKTFYKETGEVAKESWEAFVQSEPEPELWGEDREYTGTEGGAAVIGMLENCATDFAEMESKARADETKHQDAYDTFLTQAKMDNAARTKDTEMKEARKGRFSDKKSGKEDSLEHTTKELEGTKQYRKDLEHACEEGDSTYGARKDARTQEITALREAQGILDKAFAEED